MLIRFLIYGLLGWSLEIVWTGFLSGIGGDPRLQATTYLWMFPIYGTAILLEPIHNSIRQWPFWVRGILWVVAIWTIEYISGGIIRYLTGHSPWNYTGTTPWQLQGLIRFDMAPLWFITGLLFEKAHDFLDRITQPLS